MHKNSPKWLRTKISDDDAAKIVSASSPRRRRELSWSRGLKSALCANIAELREQNTNDCLQPNQISFSHDRRCVAVAMTQSGAVGVDLQSDRSIDSCVRISDAWFPEQEAREIRVQDSERFMISWTIKEAWAKCCNRSIFDALKSVEVRSQSVYIKDQTKKPQFAWARWLLEGGGGKSTRNFSKCTMCVCWVGDGLPNLQCFTPTNSRLQKISLDWTWMPTVLY